MTALKHPATAKDAVSDELVNELIQLIARQAKRVPAPIFLCSACVATMAFYHQDGVLPWVWLATVTLVLALRWHVLGGLPAAALPPARKLNIAVALSTLNGVVQGASTAFTLSLDGPERAVQAIVLLGLCAGAIATTGGYLPVFTAFLLPTLMPLALVWAVGTPGMEIRWPELILAVLFCLFGLVLLSLARDAFRLFQESFQIRQEQIGLNSKLRTALDAAEMANRAKTRFLASASHDLRQPMHTLSLFSAALTMRPLDDATRQIAVHMSSALQALSEQLDALLDVSKLDAGVVPVRKTVFSLAVFLQRLEAEYTPLAQKKGLALALRCDPAAWCDTDEALLGRIVRNLLENALKYTFQGEVSINTLPAAQRWVIVVRDSGIGIPAAEQQRVFEEFYQLDNPERDRSRGLGLGLSIVRRLAELLDIEVAMTSEPGRGTEFSIAVPSGRHVSAAPPAALAPTDTHGPAQSLLGLKVLVLDDEEAVRKGMETLLQAFGCEVQLAGCTPEAVSACKTARPDILLVDLRLRGGENGLAAIRELRATCPGLPAILISGDTAPDRIKEAHQAGIPMLHKPASADALHRAIKQEIFAGGHHHESGATQASG